MRITVFAIACACLTLSASLRAEDVEPRRVRPASTAPLNAPVISPGEVTATPEMWFYEQEMMRHNDPKNAIRAAAEFKATQRRARIAASQWYGYSNTRPTAGIDNVHGPLSPQWNGNGYNPFTWVAPGNTTWLTQ